MSVDVLECDKLWEESLKGGIVREGGFYALFDILSELATLRFPPAGNIQAVGWFRTKTIHWK